jgi:hypothetical protein
MTEVRIYKIDRKSLSKVKTVLEAEDTAKLSLKCKKCNTSENIVVKASEVKRHDEGKAMHKGCDGAWTVENKEYIRNEWPRVGYILREAKSLGVAGDAFYLFVKTEDPAFFGANEPKVMIDGVEKVSGTVADQIKRTIEEEQEKAAAGMGGIFEGF